MRHWRPYLWGRPFLVRTDNYSLKFLLDQRLSTVPQHQWISKLLGFDFSVEYRPGRLNTVADALSRRDVNVVAAGPSVALALSGPTFALLDEVRRATADTPDGRKLLEQLQAGELSAPWRLYDGLLLHGSRVFVPDHGDLQQQVLLLAHSAGHEGIKKTLHRLRAGFYIPRGRTLVQDLVRSCTTCQRNKTETVQPAGLLQPLNVPTQVWPDISMDFIEGLPKVAGKSVILSGSLLQICPSHRARPPLHRHIRRSRLQRYRPPPWVSAIHRQRPGPVFTGHVWRDLFKMGGVKLHMSTAFHPQTDGQSEVVNKVIAMYLRCVTGDRPRAWVDWLSWAEYCYNTSFHTVLRATLFEVVYGRPPPPMLPYAPGTTRTEAMDALLPLETRSSLRFGNVFCKLSGCPRNTMTQDIARYSSRRATGSGCGCSTAQPTLYGQAPRANLALAMPGRSVSWNTSVAWRIVFSFQRVPVFMMCTTWGCLSATAEIHRLPQALSLRPWTVGCRLLLRCSVRINVEASGKYSSSGKAFLKTTRLGRSLTSSAPSTPTSSSRTSCLRRRGEML